MRRIEVRAVRPGDGVAFGIETHQPEITRIGERAVDLSDQDSGEIDRLGRSVSKRDPKREIADLFDGGNSVDLVVHGRDYLNGDRPLRPLLASGGFFLANGLRHLRIATAEPELLAIARHEIVIPMLVELLQRAP